MKWINELAKKMNLKEYFWENENEALEFMLQPSKISFADFKKKRIIRGEQKFRKPEEGFRTPSGKVEIYSKQLADFGYSPMPLLEEVSRFRFAISEEYPLLMTNAKESAYYLSGYRQVAYLRKITPEPLVELHPETARKYGLKEGNWIYIETRKGRVKQKLTLNPDLDPRVVFAAFGWYFPEEASNLYEWTKSNINILTESDPPDDAAIGSVELRGVPCKVYAAAD
jgi:anaerobic selenocysteine-containing dehydrogenase